MEFTISKVTQVIPYHLRLLKEKKLPTDFLTLLSKIQGITLDKSLIQTRVILKFFMCIWHFFHSFKYVLFMIDILILWSRLMRI